jgi:hypothetical protein
VHISQGLDFLGWRIQRHPKRGTTNQHYVYTYPSKKALAAITAKVKDWCCKVSRRARTVQPGDGQHHPIPLPRNNHPLTLATHGMTNQFPTTGSTASRMR